jgi:lipopolysaccharide/colanic/teichoic acid biosynthesis glycosyltransferase
MCAIAARGSSLDSDNYRVDGAGPGGLLTSYDVIPSSYFRWKGVLDRTLAGLLLIPGLPIVGLLALLVRTTSRGPGILRQVRIGKDGQRFTMYKIRTMRSDAEALTGTVWAKPMDPRVTGVGRVLRRFHLDEFPQLFNVLRGNMSLIGPRPERPEFVEILSRQIPGYLNRLAVHPGITGLAQLNLPPDTDLESVKCKLVLDLQYVERARLLLDVRLLLCTLARLFKLPAVRLLGLERRVVRSGQHAPSANGSARGDYTSPDKIVAAAPPPDGDGKNGTDHETREGLPGQAVRKPR